jgi:hypothetical protein
MPNLNPARIAPPQPRWAPSMLHRRDKLNVNCLAHRVDVIDAYTLLRAPSTVAEVRKGRFTNRNPVYPLTLHWTSVAA